MLSNIKELSLDLTKARPVLEARDKNGYLLKQSSISDLDEAWATFFGAKAEFDKEILRRQDEKGA